MSLDMFADVLEFHEAMVPHLIGTTPKIPAAPTRKLRWALVREEAWELFVALFRRDLARIADAIADLIYVLLGMAISYGIDIRPVWDAVQSSNMAKVSGPVREDGKRLKPPGWQPPDIAGILASQPPLRRTELPG